jgi:predicted permease
LTWTLARDSRLALRGLRRDWGFTAVALLSLALGIGANTAIFSLVDQVLLRLLPVKDPGTLVQLEWSGPFLGKGWGSDRLLSNPFYRALARDNQVFTGLFARAPFKAALAGAGAPEQAAVELVSGSYFSVLGVAPALGRVLDDSDDRVAGAHPVVMLSHDYWRNHFAARPDVIGTRLLVNTHPMTVVGVAAAGFRGLDRAEAPDVFIPIMMKSQVTPEFDWLEDWRGAWLHVFGRLRPGVQLPAARAALHPWFQAMLAADVQREGFPHASAEQRARFLASTLELHPAGRGTDGFRGRLEQPLLVLMAATFLVLLLACLNVANLSLARFFARRRELALRAALGATRTQLLRQLLVQTAMLALAGGALGVLLAPAVTRALIRFLPPAVDLSPQIDLRVLAFSLAVTTGTALLFGLVPALTASRAQPAAALKAQSSTVSGGLRLRKALVVGQIALALVLLIGAGLFLRTLRGLRAQGPGFATTNLIQITVQPIHGGYGPDRARQLLRRLLESVQALPEIDRAGLATSSLLKGGSWNGEVTLDNGRRTVSQHLHFNAVSPGFFATLGAPILMGRDFDSRDADSPGNAFRVAIINEQMARRYFGERSPLGAHLGLGTNVDTSLTVEIVGVVKSFHYRGMRETEDQAYFPAFEHPLLGGTFYLRTHVGTAAAVAAFRAALASLDPDLPLQNVRTVDDQLDESLLIERMLATLATAFATLATLLVVIGLYGVMSFAVGRRTREIGIRLALGATAGAAVGAVLRETAALVALGLALALTAVWLLGRLVESQLYGVRPLDLPTTVAAAAVIAAVALLASALPARRASTVNPTEALRAE